MNEARRVRMWLREGRVNRFTPLIPRKTRYLVLREKAFVHKEYKNDIQRIHGSVQAESI